MSYVCDFKKILLNLNFLIPLELKFNVLIYLINPT